MEHVRARAENAARRLLNARPPGAVPPSDRLQMIDLIEHMAKTPGKYGVKLMPYEQKAIKMWNRFLRLAWGGNAEQAG